MGTQEFKVVVLGPGEAGKSTLIAALCRDALNLAVQGRTVALDHGTCEYEGCFFHFFGVPGQERFAPVQESLLRGCSAAVVVVAHGNGCDPLTRKWCQELHARGVPLVWVVNRFNAGAVQRPEPPPITLGAQVLEMDLAQPGEVWQILPTLCKLLRKEKGI